jgi:type IV secretory pathway protease TraF
MAPTLLPGDLLAVRPLRSDEPRNGQIVVARARNIETVKRVVLPPDARALPNGSVWLQGDGTESTDSRTTGPVSRSDLVGVVRARYWPPWRAHLF